MKNDLVAMQNRIFAQFDKLAEMNLKGDELKLEIDKHLTLIEWAKTAVANGALMTKAADTLYGLPVSDELPLIPPSKGNPPVLAMSKKKLLTELPKVGREIEV
jgi:hypothetical protein